MKPWKELGSNIIKLEGYGLYVTYIDSKVYVSEMTPNSGLPTLDPDKNIEWTELSEPPNQKFLNLVNAKFGITLTMHDFGGVMSITEIKEFVKLNKEERTGVGNEPLTPAEAIWLVKNMREKEK